MTETKIKSVLRGLKGGYITVDDAHDYIKEIVRKSHWFNHYSWYIGFLMGILICYLALIVF